MLIFIAIGFVSGIISGMGIGGGTVLIPALAFFSRMAQHQAQGVNLIYFIPTAAVALVTHKKNGNIETKNLKPLVIFGLAGAAAGSLIAVGMEGDVLRKVFGGFLFVMGIVEIFKKEE